MSNDNTNPFERLFKLWAMVCKLVLDGKRDPVLVADALQKVVDENPNMIVRGAIVNRLRSPQAAIDATGRKQYVNASVVASMPRGTGAEAEIVFFRVGRFIKDDDLDKEYALRGLKPADPYSLAKVNEDDHAFADKHPNATHWKDSNGKWCYTAFYRGGDGRIVEFSGATAGGATAGGSAASQVLDPRTLCHFALAL